MNCSDGKLQKWLVGLMLIVVWNLVRNSWYLRNPRKDQKPHLLKDRKTFNKITYVVYSSFWQPFKFQSRIEAIANTWAKKLAAQDQIVYVPMEKKTTFNDTLVQFFKFSQSTFFNWQKPVSTMLYEFYVMKKHNPTREWFYFAPDCSYVIPVNLQAFVDGLNPNLPYYLGHPLHIPTHGKYSWRNLNHLLFNTNTGTLFSWKAVEIVATNMDNGCLNRCISCNDDLAVAFCLREKNVFPMDTRDSQGRNRFNVFQPGSLVNNQRKDVFDYAPSNCEWYRLYAIWKPRTDLTCCSRGTINFHYTNAAEIYAIHSTIYNSKFRSNYNDKKALQFLISNKNAKTKESFSGFIDPKHVAVRKLLMSIINVEESNNQFARTVRRINESFSTISSE